MRPVAPTIMRLLTKKIASLPTRLSSDSRFTALSHYSTLPLQSEYIPIQPPSFAKEVMNIRNTYHKPQVLGKKMELAMGCELRTLGHRGIIKKVEIQPQFKTGTTKKIPDATVTLDNGVVLVVDSKVSNSRRNFREAIHELSSKNYPAYVPNALPISFLWLPSEADLYEMYRGEPEGVLWANLETAWKKRVLIVAPETFQITVRLAKLVTEAWCDGSVSGILPKFTLQKAGSLASMARPKCLPLPKHEKPWVSY